MIEVYGKKGCSRCQGVMNILNSRGIDYKYIGIESLRYPDHIRDLIELENNGIYPLLMDDGKIVSLKDILNRGK